MIINYLNFIKSESRSDGLARQTAKYIAEHLQFTKFVLCKHYPTPQPVEIVANYDTTFDLNIWLKSCEKSKPEIQPLSYVYHEPYHYIFLNQNYATNTSYFLVSTNKPNEDVMETIVQWDRLEHHFYERDLAITYSQKELHGNLISQLLHDIQSLMRLQSNTDLPKNIDDQLKYQQKVNDNLLFFIRPLELLNSEVALKELLKSSLDLVELDIHNFNITYEAAPATISIDSEMFARAFNEIVFNAMEAVEFDEKKCKITLKQIASTSPLISKNWLKLVISDFGSGISEDYLAQIKEPFFTTKKNKGHSGFGLSIADKILTAIGGYLDISSDKGNGTVVNMYVPLKND